MAKYLLKTTLPNGKFLFWEPQYAIYSMKRWSLQSFESREGNLERYDTIINLTLGVPGVQLIFLRNDKDR